MIYNEGDLVTVPGGKGEGRRLAKVFRDLSDGGECSAIWVRQWIDEAWYEGYHPFHPDEVELQAETFDVRMRSRLDRHREENNGE